MNILLVDDDVYTIEALKQSLDWKALGIENAYYAYGTSQAKKIMEDVPIHILVSDIEMPKENGFALLEWIREKGFVVQEILLTMYAEFQYAKQAILYDCFAYVLKPINYDELSEMIKGAIQKEIEEINKKKNEHDSNLWVSSERIRKEHFFSNLLLSEELEETYALSYDKETTFLPMIVRNFERSMQMEDPYGNGMQEWEIKNLLRKNLSKNKIETEAILKSSKGLLVVICLYDVSFDEEALKQAINDYFIELEKKKNVTASAFIGNVVTRTGLANELTQFEYFALHKISKPREIQKVITYNIEKVLYQPANFKLLEKLLLDHQIEALKGELNRYFAEQEAQSSMTYKNLYRVTGDFLQMIYSVLRSNGIMSYEMTEAIFSEELLERAQLNIAEAKFALFQMAETAIQLTSVNTGEKSIEDKVIDYIEENIAQEMTRESIAEMVYLNPDYLSRIFKKKTNLSIGAYILERRLELAKMYLEKTEEPVNLVAIKCGYDNFSYFAKVFKNKTSLTPKDYRKQFLSKNNTI